MTLLRMAASYRQSADLLRVRIIALTDELARTEDPKERGRLEQRIKDLNTLYRETREAALVMERYYDRRYHKHGRHTR